MKKILYSAPVLAVGSAFANQPTTPTEWYDTITADGFMDVIGAAAPIAIAVVVAVAGVRVFIKLINRGAGK